MANIHSYVFLVALLVFLPTFFAEARKLANSNGISSVDLIHRHSPLSPYYNSSMTRRERLLSRLTSKHNDKDVKSLELIAANNQGEYLLKFTLGTPQVEQFAVADTGSSLIWVQCAPCEICTPQKFPFFDPTKSSTFHTISCASKACNHNNLEINHISCPSNQNATNSSSSSSSSRSNTLPCLYKAGYGDGTQSIGILATDTLGFPSRDTSTSASLPPTIFGCGYDQNGTHNGIVGLGTGPSSLISQLGPKVNYKFSYCLSPLSLGLTSKLNFGTNVTGHEVVSTPFTTGIIDYHYHLTLDGISIGVKDHPIKIHTPVALDMIIDSGTTLTLLPQSVFDSLKETIANAIALTPVSCPINNVELCYKTRFSDSSRKFNPPDVVFHFRGADVVLKAENMFVEIDDNLIALAMRAVEGTFVFGNIAQVNFHIGYDLQAKQVSFAPSDCAKY